MVEDVPGAGSNIATDRVAKAPADGYLLLMGGNPSLVINPSLYETLPFDPQQGFRADLAGLHRSQRARRSAGAAGQERGGTGRAGQGAAGQAVLCPAGVGTSQHLAAELFKYMAHLDIAAVPYRGSTALIPDLLANRVSMSFANIVNVLPLVREGKLRALGHHLDQALGAGAGSADDGGNRIPRF